MVKTNEIAARVELIELTNPNDIMVFATNLKDLIVQNHLYTNIKGKNYVNVEGWQIAGAFTGVFPIVEKVENLSEGSGKYKYRAEVTLRDKDNNIVGSGMAICTNQEAGKKNFDEYAVASMAQTRAVGKAFRMKIGWLLKVAGYETTPAEEMDTVTEAEVVPKQTSMREVSIAVDRLSLCQDLQSLKSVWDGLDPKVRLDPAVKSQKDLIKSKLMNSEKVSDGLDG